MARQPLPAWGSFGVAALVAVHAGLFLGIEPIVTYFYEAVWWGYILAADGLLHARLGRSPLASLRWGYLVFAGWSFAFWLLFEAYNFRLANWHYVEVPPGFWTVRLRGLVAYATVLPGLFTTAFLIESLPAVARLRWGRLPVPRRAGSWLAATGAVALALPLLAPGYAFPLVWVGLALLLDPWNRSRGAPSLLADLEAGRPARLLAFLAAGAACGLLWETWNWRAGTRWVYTVPYVGDVRLFEMPVLGFLGFPPFALEAFAAYATLERLAWAPRLLAREPGQDPASAPRWRPRGVAVVLGALLVAAWALLVLEGIERWTVASWCRECR